MELNFRTADVSLNGENHEYCKAVPNSIEWQAYQEQRMSSLRELKKKNKKLEKELLPDPAKEKTKKAEVANLGPNVDALNEVHKD